VLAKLILLVLAAGYLAAGASGRLFDRLVRPGVDAQRGFARRLRLSRPGSSAARYRTVRIILVVSGVLFIAADLYGLFVV
jgi:hypothetical protein